MSATAPFGQVITAMVTPFHKDGKIDEAGVAVLVEHLLANGSDGIVVCGTTGESATLSNDEKLRLFRLVKQAAKGRGSVIAGTGSNDTSSSIALTTEAAELGLDAALLVVPPYNKPSQEGLYQHFSAIANAVPKLPCILYNVPPRTAQNLEPATCIRLAKDVVNIVAVKEASGNLVQCAEIAAGVPEDFAIYSGDDGLALPMLAIGGCGVISVTAHLVGRKMKAMHTAFFSGELRLAAKLNCEMLPVVRACFQSTTPSPVPLKSALNLLGLPGGSVRLPLVSATEAEHMKVRQMLLQQGLLAN